MKNRRKETWNFDNSYARLPEFFYTILRPTPVSDPGLVVFNDPLAAFLQTPRQVEVFSGNEVPHGAEPLAQAYAGHQFGHFTMLGDGRAHLLGEQISLSGERYDIQLKGSGRTPYSRGGDGRAALGPMLREYIVSEAMYHLGIPTTRSLAVVATGEVVRRERALAGAILTRVAKSHIRVGTFEYAFCFGTKDDVRTLADYTITRHFPSNAESEDEYLLLLREVVRRQAHLVARWQQVGFIHGVMNTDNMAISGETIDYGPCAFMDTYHPKTVFSSIDTYGRYAYDNQPGIAAWNLARFAETLLPLLHEDKREAIRLANKELEGFWEVYNTCWLTGMKAKLGLFENGVEGDAEATAEDGTEDDAEGGMDDGTEGGAENGAENGAVNRTEDKSLIRDLLQLMQRHQADYTNTFRSLTLNKFDDTAIFSQPDFLLWHKRWQSRLDEQERSKDECTALMKRHNPAIIPRNHRVEEALSAAENGDLTIVNRLLHALENPYGHTSEQEEFSELPAPTPHRYRTFCGT